MWQFLLQNCRVKFIPADVMFCGNFTRQLLTRMEGGRENVSKVVIKSDFSPAESGGWERKGTRQSSTAMGTLGTQPSDKEEMPH